jgi:hypothetical protein
MLIDGRGFPLSLFLLTIAATSERKSAVDQAVLRPHRDAEYQADKDMDSLCALYEMELAAWEKEKSVLINDGKRTVEEKQFALEQLQRRKPKKPLDQKRLVSDFTFEGMYKLFQAGVPSKVLFADESQAAMECGRKLSLPRLRACPSFWTVRRWTESGP